MVIVLELLAIADCSWSLLPLAPLQWELRDLGNACLICALYLMIAKLRYLDSIWARNRSLKSDFRYSRISLQWRHNERVCVPNHLTIVYSTVYSSHRSKKTSELRVTGLSAGNSPVTGEIPAQMASYAENVSIWWRHNVVAVEYHQCCKTLNVWHGT